MSDWFDKAEDIKEDANNKAHELKGKAEQKKKDLENSND